MSAESGAADVDAGQVLVCSGFAQGLSLTLVVLAARGVRHVGFEDPGYDRAVEATAHRAGVTAIPIPVDQPRHRCWCPGVLEVPRQLWSAPHINGRPVWFWRPVDVVQPGRRAAQVDGFVVEDDYDAEFRYDRDPVGSLQGLAPDRVVTIGTVSKSLAPHSGSAGCSAPPN